MSFPRLITQTTLPLIRPFQSFFKTEASGGILLLICTAVALLWANSPASETYFSIWETVVTVGAGGFVLSKPLLLWINDGLMAVFFFVIGLEIKREVMTGELSSPRQAALSLAAAVGGMVVPAVFYLAFNMGGESASGWAVPMATDIAFALGVLALLGSRVPVALKVFLTALAIVDDLGAVLVIAFFYTAQLSGAALLVAGGFLLALIVANRLGVRWMVVYLLLGTGLWVAVLKSGVHATIAGVVAAFTIPATRRLHPAAFLDKGLSLLSAFAKDTREGDQEPTTDQRDAIYSLEKACEDAEAPLTRLEHGLHKWVAFLIMPVFALANAGVALGGTDLGVTATHGITLGVVLGLVLGKQLGVLGAAWLAVRSGLAVLPEGVNWRHIYGVSMLCGIGFTMSIFIANLAFGSGALLDFAKIGILSASVISGLLGWWYLRLNIPRT